MLHHKNITDWESRELRIGGSLSFAFAFADTLWRLESSHGLQKTSIATGEYPCYTFVLCHLMVMPCVS